MEDAHICTEIDLPGGKKGMLFGVFDGHGGKEVAVYVEAHYINHLTGNADFKKGNFEAALKQSFHDMDSEVGK